VREQAAVSDLPNMMRSEPPAGHRPAGRGTAPAKRSQLPAHDALSTLRQSAVFAASIGCLFGVVALLARLL
jgi:hypothetical protein